MFSFVRGKTQYVLRPEMTAPVVRAYVQHHLDQRPGEQRLFYMGPCFRAERPQKGRYRQFHQFGAEILGTDDPRADAEIITCTLDIYRELGLTDMVLQLNTLGDAACRARYKQALVEYFTARYDQLSLTSRQRLESNPLRILDTKEESERELIHGAPLLVDYVDASCREHYDSVKAYLEASDVAFVENPLLVRGLDYYSRTAFEVESPAIGAQSALAGGGRYDHLSESIGSKHTVPAVGFAAGMERLILAMDAGGVTWPKISAVEVFLVAIGPAAAREVFPLARRLRQAGLCVRYSLGARSMKAQMRTANRLGAQHCVVVGDEELALGRVKVKDMSQGTQQDVSIDLLDEYLVSHSR